MKKDLAYYRGLPYRLEVDRFVDEEDGRQYYSASYPVLPNVKGVHEDRQLALKLAKEMFDSYIEALLEWGEDVPEPDAPRFRKPGGLHKIVVREMHPERIVKLPTMQTTQKPPQIEQTVADPVDVRVAVPA